MTPVSAVTPLPQTRNIRGDVLADLRPLIEAGYARTTSFGVPTPASFSIPPDLGAALKQSSAGVGPPDQPRRPWSDRQPCRAGHQQHTRSRAGGHNHTRPGWRRRVAGHRQRRAAGCRNDIPARAPQSGPFNRRRQRGPGHQA